MPYLVCCWTTAAAPVVIGHFRTEAGALFCAVMASLFFSLQTAVCVPDVDGAVEHETRVYPVKARAQGAG